MNELKSSELEVDKSCDCTQSNSQTNNQTRSIQHPGGRAEIEIAIVLYCSYTRISLSKCRFQEHLLLSRIAGRIVRRGARRRRRGGAAFGAGRARARVAAASASARREELYARRAGRRHRLFAVLLQRSANKARERCRRSQYRRGEGRAFTFTLTFTFTSRMAGLAGGGGTGGHRRRRRRRRTANTIRDSSSCASPLCRLSSAQSHAVSFCAFSA